jgi:hypothetical protein
MHFDMRIFAKRGKRMLSNYIRNIEEGTGCLNNVFWLSCGFEHFELFFDGMNMMGSKIRSKEMIILMNREAMIEYGSHSIDISI